MQTTFSPLPDDFDLDEYEERFAAAIVREPERFRGKWAYAGERDDVPATLGVDASNGEADGAAMDSAPANPSDNGTDSAPVNPGIGSSCSWADDAEATAGGYSEVRLDLGCGKGSFAVEMARRLPDVLFVGIDIDRKCIAQAAALACKGQVSNAVFSCTESPLEDIFEEHELAAIHLNFPTPHPKGHDAHLRLTEAGHLDVYRNLLAEDGTLEFQTDSYPLFQYTLGQLELAGFAVESKTDDLMDGNPNVPISGYGRRAIEMGAKVMALSARPCGGREPRGESNVEPRQPNQSLYDYLPEDLDAMTYLPPDMKRGIEAIRRTRRQSEEKHGSTHLGDKGSMAES
ncbi:MAG: tRNA (guanine(46)-N(7))-methyltransferase TrmB [Coriobacteriales bacterium]|jgi:tRNA (guanine-N7-)-methyltransferase